MSSLEILTRIIRPLNRKINKEFRVMLMAGLESYRRHNTREKLANIILNLPVGAILDKKEIDRLLGENKTPPTYQELLNILDGTDPRIAASIKEK